MFNCPPTAIKDEVSMRDVEFDESMGDSNAVLESDEDRQHKSSCLGMVYAMVGN